MAAAVQLSPPAPAVPTKDHIHTQSCPSCGISIDMAELADARQRIEELEAQMERLKEKATAAGTCAHPERNHLPTRARQPATTSARPTRTDTTNQTISGPMRRLRRPNPQFKNRTIRLHTQASPPLCRLRSPTTWHRKLYKIRPLLLHNEPLPVARKYRLHAAATTTKR